MTLNYYQILGVEKTAGDEEIKRAYFSMVRKFQPSSSPEKFKEIRNAYDTLKDKQKRAEYDAIGELPKSIAPLFNEAQWLDHLGKHSKAAELYQKILKRHPELDNVREKYAISFDRDQKTGKAIEVWEELCRRNPANARYSKELAECYLNRSWHKKAASEVERAIALDPLSIAAWSVAIDCVVAKGMNNPDSKTILEELKTIVEKAIKTVKGVKENEWQKIYLYSYAFTTSPSEDKDAAKGYLEEIARLIREGGQRSQKGGMRALVMILGTAPDFYLMDFYIELKNIADQLSELTNEKTRSNPLRAHIENLKFLYEAENLKKKGFSEVFCELFKLLNKDFEDDDDEIELAAMEFEILENKSTYDPQLRRLREEFPELYSLHSGFFNEALRTRNHEKMLFARAKKVNKHTRATGFFEENPDSGFIQPVRRTEPKIGRNDPCPCGSGKKYKKCCGA